MAESSDYSLELATNRMNAGATAGDAYIETLEEIRDDLNNDGSGASLGTMVGAQLQMTETETTYMIESGLPKKASSANMQAAQEIKKAAG